MKIVVMAAMMLVSAAGRPRAATFEQVLAGVDRYYESLRSLAADFTQLVQVPALEKSETFRGRLYFLKPHFLRLEYSRPEGQLLVVDGTNYWFYMPQEDVPQAMRAPLDDQQSPLFVLGGRMGERFSGTLAGTEKRGGHECHVLDLAPLERQPHYSSLRAWVDVGTFATRAIRYVNRGGDYNTFELSGIEENTGLGPERFSFTPPPGTQILETD